MCALYIMTSHYVPKSNRQKNLSYAYATVYQLGSDSWANSTQILHYTTIYYTILYYTILYYTILYYTILHYYYIILYYAILYYAVLYYTTIHYTIP